MQKLLYNRLLPLLPVIHLHRITSLMYTKKQLVAFHLEVIFPFGVGHLYAKRTLNGMLKLLFVILFPCLMCCIAICSASSLSQKVGPFLIMGIGALYGLGSIAWLIIDLIFFGTNKYMDGNSVPLLEW